jgi:predicted RNA binding protein YcfA (HicA-like mRNA interferase family)
MNTQKLLRHLIEHNCYKSREGGNHEVWHRHGAPLSTAVPRHRETGPGLVRKICRDLEVPVPPEK